MKKLFSILFSAMFLSSLSVHAQLLERTRGIIASALKGVTYEVRAGFNVGGTAPLPIPEEIRSIDSYSPTMAFSIGADVKKKFDDRWGMQFGVRIESKGMKTEAQTKQYHMSITGFDGEQKTGYWTGRVKTNVSQSSITFPVLATYSISTRWDIKLGPYVSILTDKEFTGSVFDGYLREDTPTGDKMDLTNGGVATYDFSNDMRHFQWGIQLGAEWKAFKHLNVFGDLSWGCNNIFKSDFETITFSMYPIYATLGFGYAF